jgi:TetR/AcrR family transcriptional regulator
MVQPGGRIRRIHNAQATRAAILNAAEVVFTEHGFDGARVDAVAAEAGYNKSLIFQYFGDKLGLYTEVIRRADQELNILSQRVLAPLFAGEGLATDARAFRAVLETIVGLFFDYLVAHPNLVRMLLWEQAEGWKTYRRIFAQFNTDDFDQIKAIFDTARQAGILRSGFVPELQIISALQLCLSYLAWLPMYQLLLPDQDHVSGVALAHARDYLVAFVVGGLIVDRIAQS